MRLVARFICRINAEGVRIVLVEPRIRAALAISKSMSVLRLGRSVYSGEPGIAADPERLAGLLYTPTQTLQAS